MRASDRGGGLLQYVDRFNQLVKRVMDITENEKFTVHKSLTSTRS